MNPPDQRPTTPLILDPREPANLLQAVQVIRDGGIVAIPTDTVYGLAASMFHAPAIERIFRVKRRPIDTRLPVLIASAADLPLLTRRPPAIAWRLIEAFWPGALTLVLEANPGVPESIKRGRNTVGIRVPAGRTILQVLESLGEPIAATSANIHGYPALTASEEVIEHLGGLIDAVVIDGRPPSSEVVSTVVEVREEMVNIVREGAISSAVIKRAIGARAKVSQHQTSGDESGA